MRIKIIFFVLLSFICFAGFAEESKSETEQLTRVQPIKVCMVNDQVFEKDQISVEVDGKTYYGCCQMCKKTLSENKESRVGVDPISGKEVDKATAVIGANKEGKTFYFENEKNFEEFNNKKQ